MEKMCKRTEAQAALNKHSNPAVELDTKCNNYIIIQCRAPTWVQVGRKALSPAANQCVSHHAVHGEVAVLGLQLHSMGVVVADLCVACQEQTLVVHDPVEHLRHDDKYTHREKISIKNESTDTQGLGSLLTPADCCKNLSVFTHCCSVRTSILASIQRNGLPLLRASSLALLENNLWPMVS